MAQLALGIAGGAIGAVVAGPVGMRWGFMAGTLAGGLLFPPDQPTIKQEGPRLSDLSVTSAGYGNSIPFGIGTSRLTGDIIWSPGISETVHTDTQTAGGKGIGGGQETQTTTYTYSVDLAIALCEGPIDGVTRVWADGKLIIDRTGTGTLTEVANLSYRLYTGTDDQMPDPLIEADKGVGQVPAHRGLAYIVFENFALENFAGHIPAFTFEVTKAGQTSYPILVSDTPQTEVVHVDETRGLIYAYLDPDLVILDLFSLAEVNRLTVGSFPEPCIAGGDTGVVIYSTAITNYTHTGFINKDTLEIKPFPMYSGPGPLGITGFTKNSMAIITTAISYTIVYRGWYGGMQAYSFARQDAGGGLGAILKDTDHYDATAQCVPGTSLWGGGLLDTGVLYGNNRVHTYQLDPWYFRQFGAQSHTNLITLICDKIEVSYLLSQDAGGEPSASVMLYPVKVQSVNIASGISGIGGTMFHDEHDDTYVLDNGKGISGGITAQKIDPNTLTVLLEYPSPRTYGWSWDSDSSRQQVRSGHYWQRTSSTIHIVDQTLADGSQRDTVISGHAITGTGIYHMVKMGGGYGITGIDGKIGKIFLGRFTPEDGASIRDYVADVLTRCGLDPTLDADLSALDQTVYGYFTAQNTAGRTLVQPLAQLFAFDVVESDYVLKFVKRNGGPVATITTEQFVVTGADDGAPYSDTLKQESELPAQIALTYADPTKDYDPTTVRATRPSNPNRTMFADGNVSIQAPVTMLTDQAKGLVGTLLYTMWNERLSYAYNVDSRFLPLDPGDVVLLQDAVTGEQTAQRITDIQAGADLTVALNTTIFDAGTYLPADMRADPGDGWNNQIAEPQPTQIVVLDVPMLRDQDNIPLAYTLMAGYGRAGWRGGLAYVSADGGATYKYRGAQASEATIGTMLDALPATDRPFATDNETVVRVRIQTQPEAMAGTTQSDMVTNFANAAAVRSGSEWEIIQFRDCVQDEAEENVFVLSGLLRGRRGTDYCTDDHRQYDRFVLLAPADVSYMTFLPADIAKTFQVKAASPGQTLESLSAQNLTYEGNSLRPYAPVHLAWTKSGADLVLNWERRTRFGGELNSGTTGVDTGSVPVNESTEAYQIVVKSGAATLATYDVAAARTWTYTAAMQAADGFGPGAYVTIYQMSELAGRGFPSKPLYYGANADVAELQAVAAQVKAQDLDVAQVQAVAVTTISEYVAVAQVQPVVVEAPKTTRIYQAGMSVVGLNQPFIDIQQAGMSVIGMIVKG